MAPAAPAATDSEIRRQNTHTQAGPVCLARQRPFPLRSTRQTRLETRRGGRLGCQTSQSAVHFISNAAAHRRDGATRRSKKKGKRKKNCRPRVFPRFPHTAPLSATTPDQGCDTRLGRQDELPVPVAGLTGLPAAVGVRRPLEERNGRGRGATSVKCMQPSSGRHGRLIRGIGGGHRLGTGGRAGRPGGGSVNGAT